MDRMGRRHQKARKRTNYGDSVFVGGGGGISERESTCDVRTKSESFFRSETAQEVGSRTKVKLCK